MELGAKFKYDEATDKYFLESPRLQGKYILMDEISVTGTANILMGAVLQKDHYHLQCCL